MNRLFRRRRKVRETQPFVAGVALKLGTLVYLAEDGRAYPMPPILGVVAEDSEPYKTVKVVVLKEL